MGSGGTQWDTDDLADGARLNQKTIFVGTGAQINALATTYAGQLAYCTSTGSGFTVERTYKRNSANSAWVDVHDSFDISTYARLLAQAETRYADSDSSNYVGFKAPATIASDKIWTLPDSDGKKNYHIKTDGSAVLAFENMFAGKAYNALVNADTTSHSGIGNETVANSNAGVGLSTDTSTNDDCRAYRAHIGAAPSQPFILYGYMTTSGDAAGSITLEWGTYNGTAVLNTTQDTVSFKCISGSENFIARSANGTTQQTTDTGVAYATTTVYRFMIVSDGSSVRFYLNGVLKATHSTNIPDSGTQYPSMYIRTDTNNGADSYGEITMIVDE